MLHVRDLGDPLQQFDLPAVVHGHESAYLGVHAPLVHARTELLLLGAFEAVHVGRRPSHIPEHAVESRFGCYLLGLPEDGLLAPGDDRPALHDGYGAEVAFAVASAVRGYGVPDGIHRFDVSLLRVVRVDFVLEIHLVDAVQRLGIQYLRGSVLDQIPVAGLLDKPPRIDGVAVVVELLEHAQEVGLVLDAGFVTGNLRVGGRGDVGNVADAPDRMPVLSVTECLRKLERGHLAHAVGDDVRLGIEQYGSSQAVRPCVVVGEPPETGLDASEHDRLPLDVFLDQIGVSDTCPVRTAVVDPSGCEVVVLAELPGGGVVGDHGVDASRGNPPEQVRFAETRDVVSRFHIGLGYDAHLETVLDQPVSDHSRSVV